MCPLQQSVSYLFRLAALLLARVSPFYRAFGLSKAANVYESGDSEQFIPESKNCGHREAPLCSLFLFCERGSVTQRATFLWAILTLTTALLVGCGGQDMRPSEEKGVSVEEVSLEAPVESLPSYDPGPDTDSEICQTGEALEDIGPERLQRLSDELSEEVSAGRFTNMQEAFASRGYTCNGLVKVE